MVLAFFSTTSYWRHMTPYCYVYYTFVIRCRKYRAIGDDVPLTFLDTAINDSAARLFFILSVMMTCLLLFRLRIPTYSWRILCSPGWHLMPNRIHRRMPSLLYWKRRLFCPGADYLVHAMQKECLYFCHAFATAIPVCCYTPYTPP